MENRDFKWKWLSHCCWQEVQGNQSRIGGVKVFLHGVVQRLGTAKTKNYGPKKLNTLNQASSLNKKFTWNEFKMMQSQLMSWGFQFQSLIMKMSSKNPKSWCIELPKQKKKTKKNLNRYWCPVSPTLKSETGEEKGFPGGSVVKNLPANAKDRGDVGSIPRVRRIPWKRKWQPTPVFLPGKSHGQRSLLDYSPWGCKESDTTEQLSVHREKKHRSAFVITGILKLLWRETWET